jgi:hypothetical protein
MIKRVCEFVSRYKWRIAAGVVLLALGWMGYLRLGRGLGWAAWTGFAGETLLDWLELLIIPLCIRYRGLESYHPSFVSKPRGHCAMFQPPAPLGRRAVLRSGPWRR